jgi:hypothetical protein
LGASSQGASWQWLTEVTRDVNSAHNGTLEHTGHSMLANRPDYMLAICRYLQYRVTDFYTNWSEQRNVALPVKTAAPIGVHVLPGLCVSSALGRRQAMDSCQALRAAVWSRPSSRRHTTLVTPRRMRSVDRNDDARVRDNFLSTRSGQYIYTRQQICI